MYYIGIDISKFKHDCAVIDDSGEIVTPSWSFTSYSLNPTTSHSWSSIRCLSTVSLNPSLSERLKAILLIA